MKCQFLMSESKEFVAERRQWDGCLHMVCWGGIVLLFRVVCPLPSFNIPFGLLHGKSNFFFKHQWHFIPFICSPTHWETKAELKWIEMGFLKTVNMSSLLETECQGPEGWRCQWPSKQHVEVFLCREKKPLKLLNPNRCCTQREINRSSSA